MKFWQNNLMHPSILHILITPRNRGVNENTNGLIRQYFTKGSSFVDITHEQVEEVMHKLNHRPRKVLNYKIPHEVFFDENEREVA